MGGAAFDERPEQTEALINTHVMRRNNVIVHDISERDGGLQCIEVDDIQIKLLFTDDEKLLTFNVRLPTIEEANSHTIHWLTSSHLGGDAEALLKRSQLYGSNVLEIQLRL